MGWSLLRRKARRGRDVDLGLLVSEVATRLRTGATPERAWGQTFARIGIDGGERVDDWGVPLALRAMWKERGFPGRRMRPEIRLGIPPAIAVCRMSRLSGAPAAEVLDACAMGITEAGESAAARAVALAGPKASARMLAFLPLFGILLGGAMGMDPLGFLLGSALGKTIFLLGVLAEIVGIAWVRILVARAEESE